MKLTRKLIPAFAMLLVSAVLMSTASFAWFSMNTNVTADGMQVTATAPAALWISKSADRTSTSGNVVTNNFTTSIAFTSTDNLGKKAAINPVTTKPSENGVSNASNWVFYNLASESVYQSIDDEGKLANGPIFPGEGVTNANVAVNSEKDYYKTAFYILLDGKNNGADDFESKTVSVGVKVSAAEGAQADPIWQALRIGMVAVATEGNLTVEKSFVYEPTAIVATADKATAAFETAGELCVLAAQEVIQVYVYVWYEGEDLNCINANAQTFDQFTIDLNFTCP